MRYFSTQRPIVPGTFPKPTDNKVLAVENFDTFDGRKFCPAVGREAYGYIDYEKPLTAEQAADCELVPQKFPMYVKTFDGYIGTLVYLEYGEYPVYRFPGGDRIADRYEIEYGSNNREESGSSAERLEGTRRWYE